MTGRELGSRLSFEGMTGIRYLLRNFTALSVKEHLRSQIERAGERRRADTERGRARALRSRSLRSAERACGQVARKRATLTLRGYRYALRAWRSRTAISLFTSAFGNGRSTGKCRALFVIVYPSSSEASSGSTEPLNGR